MKVETIKQCDPIDTDVSVACASIHHTSDNGNIRAFADVVIMWKDHSVFIQGCPMYAQIGGGPEVKLPEWVTPFGLVRPVMLSNRLESLIKQAVLDEYNHQLLRRPRRRG